MFLIVAFQSGDIELYFELYNAIIGINFSFVKL